MEVLEQLKQRYELHIITNGFDESQSTKLAASGIRHFFGHVITSSQSGFKKPAPAMFQWALEQVGAQADEALMIGDDLLVDVKGASDVGMDQVYFNPTKKTHNAEVTYEVSCLSQLPEILYEVN
jgi:putative hydrolase of the HAD superfamily